MRSLRGMPLLSICIAVLPSCQCATSGEGRPRSARTVLFAGCAEVLSGPVCLRSSGKSITFWLPSKTAQDVRVTVDGKTHSFELVPNLGGFSFALTSTATEVRVVSPQSDPLHLSIKRDEPDPDLEIAERLRFDVATATTARRHVMNATKSKSGLVAARARSMLARMQKRAGEHLAARQTYLEAIDAHAKVGSIAAQYRDLTAAAFFEIFRFRDLKRAEALLDKAALLPAEDPEQNIQLAYYRALWLVESGRLAEAIPLLEDGERDALRLSLTQHRQDVSFERVNLLLLLGRTSEAALLIERLRRELIYPADDCARAAVVNNLGLHTVQAADPGDTEALLSAIPLIGTATSIFRTTCPDPLGVASAQHSLAEAYLRLGRPQLAHAALAASEANSDVRDIANALDLEARAFLFEGKAAQARVAFRGLEQLAAESQLPIERWQALAGLAEVAEHSGDGAEARRAYIESTSAFANLLTLIPLGSGRDDFASRQRLSGMQHVSFLLKQGDFTAALQVARENRLRSFGLLQASTSISRMDDDSRAKWSGAMRRHRLAREVVDESNELKRQLDMARASAPADVLEQIEQKYLQNQERELRGRRDLEAAMNEALSLLGTQGRDLASGDEQLSPGDLLIVMHEVPDGLAVFTKDAAGVAGRVIARDPSTISSAIQPELQRAKRIIVMGVGPLSDLDLHVLPFRETTLGEERSLFYGLDTGRSSKTESAEGVVLLVSADPTDILRGTEEAEAIKAMFEKKHRKVIWLKDEKATRDKILEHLENPDVSHFHFSGHAVFDGVDGIESRLVLERGSISSADIMALRRVPPNVVLSACEGARSGARPDVFGLGLAQAFILAGADRVLASRVPTEDGATLKMMLSTYASGTPLDPRVVAKNTREAGLGAGTFRVLLAW